MKLWPHACIATHALLPAALLSPPPWSALLGVGWVAAHAGITIELLRPRSQLFGRTIRRGPDVPHVALTFDDGPHPEDTPALLDALAAAGAAATFFFVTREARQWPELVRRVLDAGHEVGAHGATHPWWFSLAGPSRLRAEVVDGARELEQIAGAAVRWFRPPMGHKNVFLPMTLRGSGLEMIAWSARPFDTLGGSPERIRQALRPGLRPGAILLLHEGLRRGARTSSSSVAALPLILADARAAGLSPVSLAKLLG